jgi:hypothetical protein
MATTTQCVQIVVETETRQTLTIVGYAMSESIGLKPSSVNPARPSAGNPYKLIPLFIFA